MIETSYRLFLGTGIAVGPSEVVAIVAAVTVVGVVVVVVVIISITGI